MSINERISQLIKSDKSFTQKNLACAIGVAASTVNNWLKLGRSIPADYIIPISEYFDVSVDFILTGNTSSYSKTSPEDQAWLDLIHSLPEETQRDFMGAMRLHAGLHQIADAREEMKEAK